ncbi:asparaginase [Salmonella enterica]|nr:asparaginase [Salmonella enterica]
MKIRVFMATVLLLISHCVFSTTSLPHIVILATGGTIAGTAANNTQTAGYKSGELGVQTLINAVPEMNNIARVDGEQVANIGSENMTSDIILKLSQKVNALLARDDVDGVVITHGTDTLDETAYSNATTLDTFKAPEEGYLGVIVNGQPQFETRVEKIHTLRSVFDVRNIKKLPNVVIIYGYQDDPEYMYDAAIAHHADGIIYAGTGAGSVSVRSDAGIKKAEKAGIIVVRASRTGNGVVPLDKGQPGLVSDSLNPAKARVLLMTALTQTRNPELIQSYFSTY